MSLYATGGKGLKRLLSQAHHVRLLNRIAGSLMAGVASGSILVSELAIRPP